MGNPWGKGEWKGEWNDKDSRWTPALKAMLGHSSEDDGVFFMPYKSWLQYFSDFVVCYYHDSYQYSSLPISTTTRGYCYFAFDIQKPGEYYFSLNQINKRFFPKSEG